MRAARRTSSGSRAMLFRCFSAQTGIRAPQKGARWLRDRFSSSISGPDHVLAMVAVGLWGAQLGAPAIWLLPVAFPMVMAFGGMLGLYGRATSRGSNTGSPPPRSYSVPP